jgi:hypothetical protein
MMMMSSTSSLNNSNLVQQQNLRAARNAQGAGLDATPADAPSAVAQPAVDMTPKDTVTLSTAKSAPPEPEEKGSNFVPVALGSLIAGGAGALIGNGLGTAGQEGSSGETQLGTDLKTGWAKNGEVLVHTDGDKVVEYHPDKIVHKEGGVEKYSGPYTKTVTSTSAASTGWQKADNGDQVKRSFKQLKRFVPDSEGSNAGVVITYGKNGEIENAAYVKDVSQSGRSVISLKSNGSGELEHSQYGVKWNPAEDIGTDELSSKEVKKADVDAASTTLTKARFKEITNLEPIPELRLQAAGELDNMTAALATVRNGSFDVTTGFTPPTPASGTTPAAIPATALKNGEGYTYALTSGEVVKVDNKGKPLAITHKDGDIKKSLKLNDDGSWAFSAKESGDEYLSGTLNKKGTSLTLMEGDHAFEYKFNKTTGTPEEVLYTNKNSKAPYSSIKIENGTDYHVVLPGADEDEFTKVLTRTVSGATRQDIYHIPQESGADVDLTIDQLKNQLGKTANKKELAVSKFDGSAVNLTLANDFTMEPTEAHNKAFSALQTALKDPLRHEAEHQEFIKNVKVTSGGATTSTSSKPAVAGALSDFAAATKAAFGEIQGAAKEAVPGNKPMLAAVGALVLGSVGAFIINAITGKKEG